MTLASIAAISGSQKDSIFRGHPSNGHYNGFVPIKNHYIPCHINKGTLIVKSDIDYRNQRTDRYVHFELLISIWGITGDQTNCKAFVAH
jgi:hypothetical protein